MFGEIAGFYPLKVCDFSNNRYSVSFDSGFFAGLISFLSFQFLADI
jgi:hypothetical protein